jgi:hypothetical protein
MDDTDEIKEEASSPKPEEIPRPTNPIAKEAETEPDLVPPALAANGMNPQPSNGSDTNPGDGEHLDHPENWTTGDEPATDKQKGYLKVLEKQQGAPVAGDVEGMGKSEASGKIEEMRSM